MRCVEVVEVVVLVLNLQYFLSLVIVLVEIVAFPVCLKLPYTSRSPVSLPRLRLLLLALCPVFLLFEFARLVL